MRDLTEAYGLIRKFEGCRLKAYQDSVNVWTVGYGTTQGVHQGMVIDLAHAESLMEKDVQGRAALIESWIPKSCTDHMVSAMISLAYNIGMAGFHHSKLLRDLVAGQPKSVCARDFMSWVHAGGRTLPGLVNRREAEMKIFLS